MYTFFTSYANKWSEHDWIEIYKFEKDYVKLKWLKHTFPTSFKGSSLFFLMFFQANHLPTSAMLSNSGA